ncbi:MAG: pantoate--beta-alanine ligase [Ferruginibacter sp.]
MILIKTAKQAGDLVKTYRKKGNSIGFVPTMGALHQGHITLIKHCKKNTDICICSIFVNPTQFNNKADFEKYPVTIDNDIDMLEASGCDVLFLPTVKEMYPANAIAFHFKLGYLEKILEGKYRPGHFQGVCQVVDKLLSIVTPDILFIGQKDYQQCMVIKKLVQLKKYPVKIEIVPTIREKSGLAMSSRNMRLTKAEKINAVNISKTLLQIKDNIKPGDITILKNSAKQKLDAAGFKTDYVEIANAGTLKIIETWDGKTPLVALVAAYLNEIRLIDNMLINPQA